MSRHRDVRNMDYSEDYDGYDDIYGHSVDDDYYISPSNRQFIFNRENSRDQPKIGEFMRTEQDIQEEDESEGTELTDLDKAKLESCIEQVKAVLGPLSISRNELITMVATHNYDVEKVTDAIINNLKSLPTERKEKDVTNNSPKFFIPKVNGLNCNSEPQNLVLEKHPVKRFSIPSFSKFKSGDNSSTPQAFSVPKIGSFAGDKSDPTTKQTRKFDKFSDLVSSHLSKSLKNNLSIDSIGQINKITQNIDSLKIGQHVSQKVDLVPSDYEIDLSIALRATPSMQILPDKSKHDIKEKFEIPFVDCDIEAQAESILKCTFDVKDIVNIYLNNSKPVSCFGKVLCQKYKRRYRLKIKHVNVVRKLIKFDFATPSPDDNIIKHLKI